MRRLFIMGAVVAVFLVCPLVASAHALETASNPPDGADLAQGPASVTLTFSEAPDPELSSLKVLDSAGNAHHNGNATVVSGNPQQLRVAVNPLGPGIYTVVWKTVSAVDGHSAAGTVTFGVNITPQPAGANTQQGSSGLPSLLTIASRAAFYIGLTILLGGACLALFVLRTLDVRSFSGWLIVGWCIALIGLVGMIVAQQQNTDAPLSKLFSSAAGRPLWWRAALLFLVGEGLIALGAERARSRHVALWFLALTTAALMLADVAGSHAAGGPAPVINTLVQWVHFLAVGVWIGGIAALLMAVRGAPSDVKGEVMWRFSRLAGWALLTVFLSGTFRAIVEINSWTLLFTTTFGQLIIIKVVLIGVLAALGAINHYRHVPAGGKGLRGLRRVGMVELSVAVIILSVTGALVNSSPPASTAQAALSPSVTVSGNDPGTTVRVHLQISPDRAGSNSFRAEIDDFLSGKPISADSVTLRFTFPERSDMGQSTLTLKSNTTGVYIGQGDNLSLQGKWHIVAVVIRGSSSAEVPLEVTVNAAPIPSPSAVASVPGVPAVVTTQLAAGNSAQVFLDPGHVGINQLHLTFFDTSGHELPISATTATVTESSGSPIPTTPQRFSPGHFVASVTLQAGGSVHVAITATTQTGVALQAQVSLNVTS